MRACVCGTAFGHHLRSFGQALLQELAEPRLGVDAVRGIALDRQFFIPGHIDDSPQVPYLRAVGVLADDAAPEAGLGVFA